MIIPQLDLIRLFLDNVIYSITFIFLFSIVIVISYLTPVNEIVWNLKFVQNMYTAYKLFFKQK